MSRTVNVAMIGLGFGAEFIPNNRSTNTDSNAGATDTDSDTAAPGADLSPHH